MSRTGVGPGNHLSHPPQACLHPHALPCGMRVHQVRVHNRCCWPRRARRDDATPCRVAQLSYSASCGCSVCRVPRSPQAAGMYLRLRPRRRGSRSPRRVNAGRGGVGQPGGSLVGPLEAAARCGGAYARSGRAVPAGPGGQGQPSGSGWPGVGASLRLLPRSWGLDLGPRGACTSPLSSHACLWPLCVQTTAQAELEDTRAWGDDAEAVGTTVTVPTQRRRRAPAASGAGRCTASAMHAFLAHAGQGSPGAGPEAGCAAAADMAQAPASNEPVPAAVQPPQPPPSAAPPPPFVWPSPGTAAMCMPLMLDDFDPLLLSPGELRGLLSPLPFPSVRATRCCVAISYFVLSHPTAASQPSRWRCTSCLGAHPLLRASWPPPWSAGQTAPAPR